MNKIHQRGDTLVEVLLSVAILSLVIVGGSTLMNVGMQNALNSVEHTQVRNLIVGQSELLHYLRDNAKKGESDAISTTWYNTLLSTSNGYVSAGAFTPLESCTPTSGRQPFYLSVEYPPKEAPSQRPDITVHGYTNDVNDPRPYAVPGRGLWIEGVASPANADPAYIDFHIRACWSGTGDGDFSQQSNSVVRMYRQ